MRFRLQEAVDAYEQATKEDPGFAAAWAALSRSRFHGSFTGTADATMAEAELALEQAQRLAPDAAETMLAAAMLVDSFEESTAILHRVLKLRPGDVDTLIELAQVYGLQLRLEKAQKVAARAVALDPMNGYAAGTLAFEHAWDWNFSEARRYYDRALALDGDSPHPWVFSFRFFVDLWGFGDIAAAQQLLENAPPAISTTRFEILLAYVNRDLDAMRALLDATEGYDSYRSRLHRLEGNIELQQQSAESVRIAIEGYLESLLSRGAPSLDVESARARIAVAHALAGNEAEAIRIIELAVERAAAEPDRLNASAVNMNEVLTYTFLGQSDIAIERLRALLSWATPYYLTPYRLRMDPDFDALREHPGFEALLAEATSRLK